MPIHPPLSEPPLPDLNIPTDPHMSNKPYTQEPIPPQPTNSPKNLFHQLGITNWASRSTNIVRNLCGSLCESRPPSPNNHHMDQTYNPPKTLEGLIVGGWQLSPPGPHEAGPSNWEARAQEQAINTIQVALFNSHHNHQDYLPITESSPEPEELRNISNLINQRFRLSPHLLRTPLTPCFRLIIK